MFRAPKGTFDVLPPASARYARLVSVFAGVVERAGYGLLVSPMFEEAGVFAGLGGETEVVRKEMYEFEDRGGRRMALRPEGTASVVRAWIEHRPPLPWKVWYAAPSFRYESPQAGRYRQHHQLGVEALGTADPDLDVEVVSLLAQFFLELGLRRVSLRLNSLGDAQCRPGYRAALAEHLARARSRGLRLCADHGARCQENPLRVLDCKKAACLAATEDAPEAVAMLCDACTSHFARVRGGLDSLGVSYEIAPRLVRGLDYYTRTTFEFVGEALAGAQNGIGGGGRYDELAEALGGPPLPAVGFGCGVERVLAACDADGVLGTVPAAVDVFVVDTTGGSAATGLLARLRAAGLRADRAYDERSFKAQFKVADRSGARVAVIVGADEAARGVVGIRSLAGKWERTQIEVPAEDAVSAVQRALL